MQLLLIKTWKTFKRGLKGQFLLGNANWLMRRLGEAKVYRISEGLHREI